VKRIGREEERRLVKELLKEDREALRKFLDHYQKPLFSFIKKRTRNSQDAEDIVQETLIAALESLPNFKFRSSLFSWLCSIARHEIADYYRREKIKTILFSYFPFLEEIRDQALGPEGKYLRQELQQEIKTVLRQLSEGYAKILRLKYIDGLSMKAIAQKMAITVKAVESRLSRARKQFAQKWQKNQLEKLLKESSS